MIQFICVCNKENLIPVFRPPKLKPPLETIGWVTVEGLDIHVVRGVCTGNGAGVGWNGWCRKVNTTVKKPENLFTERIWSTKRWIQSRTPFATIGRKPSVFGAEPMNWLLAAKWAYASLEFLQLWSTKRVLISGFCLEFPQRECCQFKLSYYIPRSVHPSWVIRIPIPKTALQKYSIGIKW